MFVGHYSAAFVAKRAAPEAPLWLLLVAVQAVDVAWSLLVLGGVERVRLDPLLASNPLDLEHMPYTHSLLVTPLWAVLGFVLARRWLRTPAAAAAVAAAVASHWFLDLLVHRPDLPLVYGPPKLGLGLWDRPLLAFALEIGLLVAAAAWCLARRPPVFARRGRVVGLVTALVATQAVMLVAPLPGSVPALVSAVLVFFLAVAWLGGRVEAAARG
jgi:hypothetical protein